MVRVVTIGAFFSNQYRCRILIWVQLSLLGKSCRNGTGLSWGLIFNTFSGLISGHSGWIGTGLLTLVILSLFSIIFLGRGGILLTFFVYFLFGEGVFSFFSSNLDRAWRNFERKILFLFIWGVGGSWGGSCWEFGGILSNFYHLSFLLYFRCFIIITDILYWCSSLLWTFSTFGF